MIFWKIEFPNNDVDGVFLYIDESDGTKREARIKVYHELFPNDLFTRPEMEITYLNVKNKLKLSGLNLLKIINGARLVSLGEDNGD